MNCQQTFSIFALEESSYENEFAVTDICLSNTIKLGLFVAGLCCFSLLFLLSLACLLWEFRKSRHWTLKKSCFFTLFLACCGEIICYSLCLAGVHNRVKFFLFALSTLLILRTIFFIIEAWYQVFASFHPNINEMLSKMKLGFRLVTAICGVILLVIFAVIPMIEFENPFILNWFYSAGIGFLGVYSLVVLSIIIKFGHMLVSCCSDSTGFEQGGDEVKQLVRKVTRFLFFMKLLFPVAGLLILFPLWVGLSQTSTNPGLEYYSFFHFGASAITRIYAILSLLWLVLKRSNSIGMASTELKPISAGNNINELRFSGKSPEVEIEVGQPFPRFSIEELNGITKDEEKVKKNEEK